MKDMPETGPKCRQPFKNGLPESDIDSGRAELICQLKTWHSSQTHLPPLTDEHFHLFLHSCYDSVEKTKKTIEAYFTFRTESKDLFGNRDPLSPEIQDFLNICNMVQLPRATPEGYHVLFYRLTDMDPLKLFFLPAIKAFFMFNDVVLSDNGLKPGYVVIFDMKDHTLGHLARITLPLLRKLMYYIQECHPVRLKSVHVINSVPFMDKVLMLLKPFMKSEMIKMLHIHGPVESLEAFLPLEMLPEEYGGKAGSMIQLNDKHRKQMETDFSSWLKEEEQFRVDESRRPTDQASKPHDMFGIDGSFRRLDID